MQQDLIILISRIANEIAESVPVGKKVWIDRNKYEIVVVQTDTSCNKYLAVHDGRVIYDSPNKSWYEIGGETRAFVESADRKDYLLFANNWLRIIRASGVDEVNIMEKLRRGFPNFWEPCLFDDEVEEYMLVKDRCELIIHDPNSSDEDKEEAWITFTLCELMQEDGV
ncbi:hypothetical protein [Shimazuella kribbensis]|uniref:hypothetical protein n=1 Tax=Shimazuella kribbensis TaxID=139808 RepID=UPI0003FC0095|nr:hypothetical protein [Shimazuella kribbensis]